VAKLSYLGRERFHMRPCSIALWCGEGDQFERLQSVLVALSRRHDAFQRRDVEGYARLLAADYRDGGEDRASVVRRLGAVLARSGETARVLGGQIRVDRGVAEVGEDVEMSAASVEPRRERHVYRLEWRDDRWIFVGGV